MAFWITRFFSVTVTLSTKKTRFVPPFPLLPSRITAPSALPSTVRLKLEGLLISKMGGSGPFRTMVQGAEEQMNRIVSPLFAFRMAARKSPVAPGPVPGMPPLTASVSSKRVTVRAAA